MRTETSAPPAANLLPELQETRAARTTAVTEPMHRRDTTDKRLSVLVRFHNEGQLDLLDEALFSLAIQDWPYLEVLVLLQRPHPRVLKRVYQLCRDQPWQETVQWQLVPVAVPVGVDGRSKLLNEGIRAATGRYLAFLDYDDIVFQNAYAVLIDRLRKSQAPIAVGGCRLAELEQTRGQWFVRTKQAPWRQYRCRLDLFMDNFIPIHSYVLDRQRLQDFDLRFDESFTYLEDYEFLLRLATHYDLDFGAADHIVADYRLRPQGTESGIGSSQQRQQWQQARARIQLHKQQLKCQLAPTEVLRLARDWANCEQERLLNPIRQDRDALRADRDRLLQHLQTPLHRWADRLSGWSSRFPWLKWWLRRLVLGRASA